MMIVHDFYWIFELAAVALLITGSAVYLCFRFWRRGRNLLGLLRNAEGERCGCGTPCGGAAGPASTEAGIPRGKRQAIDFVGRLDLDQAPEAPRQAVEGDR